MSKTALLFVMLTVGFGSLVAEARSPAATAAARIPRTEACFRNEGDFADLDGKIVNAQNKISQANLDLENFDKDPNRYNPESVAGFAIEIDRVTGERDTAQAELGRHKAEQQKIAACQGACAHTYQCADKIREAARACAEPNPDDPNSEFNKSIEKVKADAIKDIKLGAGGFACNRPALVATKKAFEAERDRRADLCRSAVSRCQTPCFRATQAMEGSCESASKADLTAEAQQFSRLCDDHLKVVKQIEDAGNRQVAAIDRQLKDLEEGTGDGSKSVCRSDDTNPTNPDDTNNNPRNSKNTPGGADNNNANSAGDNKNDQTKKDNKNGMGNLASMLGPLMSAMMGNQTPSTPPVTNPTTTNDQDCSLAQNANNPTCICAVNPRYAGCQLALQGQTNNPVQFGAVTGYGGANLAKDTNPNLNSLDLASQQFQMPPINPANSAGPPGGGGFVGGGGGGFGGGLGGANNGGDDPGNRGARPAVSSAQILGGTTSTSGFGGPRGGGMAFIDRDGDSRSFRPRTYGKDEVLSDNKPDMRAFVPIDQRLMKQKAADRSVAAAADATYMHPAHANIFTIMHNRYENLEDPLSEDTDGQR